MNTPSSSYLESDRARRILVVDDNPAIHADFLKILCPASHAQDVSLETLEASLFGSGPGKMSAQPMQPGGSATVASRAAAARGGNDFKLDFALQGRDGLGAVERMVKRNTPYALAFIDMRMPPGWDGVETAVRIYEADPAIQVVICSAYSDYSWHDVVRRLNRPALRLLQKPFDAKDVLELAWSLTTKWLNRPPDPGR
jgi:CheY-like chemotaxis protein